MIAAEDWAPTLRAFCVQAIFAPGANLADAADEVLRLLRNNKPSIDEAAE